MRANLALLLFHFRFLPSLLLVLGSLTNNINIIIIVIIELSCSLGFGWRRSEQVFKFFSFNVTDLSLSFGILSIWIDLINIFAAIDKSYTLEHLTGRRAPLQQPHPNLLVNTYGVLEILIILG